VHGHGWAAGRLGMTLGMVAARWWLILGSGCLEDDEHGLERWVDAVEMIVDGAASWWLRTHPATASRLGGAGCVDYLQIGHELVNC
jgi:hypothetical protein